MAAEELITSDNLSKEFIKSVLDAAFLETSYDDDGDLMVKDGGIYCFLFVDEGEKDGVQLYTSFGFDPGAAELERLQAVNRINNEYRIVKAMADEHGSLVFRWDIPIAGGITRKAFVLAIRRFCAIPQDAVAECAGGVVV